MTLLSVGLITVTAAVVVVGAYMLLQQEQKMRSRQPRMKSSDIAKGHLQSERSGSQSHAPSPWSVSVIDGRDARDYPRESDSTHDDNSGVDSSTAPADQPSAPDVSSSTPSPTSDSSPSISPTSSEPGAGGSVNTPSI